jgi:hypothetical protein
MDMPLHGPGERISNYQDKTIATRVAEDFVKKLPNMIAMETVVFNDLCTIEDRVKGILAGEAVVTCDYPKYHTFSRQIYKLQKRFLGGAGMEGEVALLVARWKARGCTEGVLNRIRDEGFSIPAPAP